MRGRKVRNCCVVGVEEKIEGWEVVGWMEGRRRRRSIGVVERIFDGGMVGSGRTQSVGGRAAVGVWACACVWWVFGGCDCGICGCVMGAEKC